MKSSSLSAAAVRRQKIIEATIATLTSRGYVHTSLADIAAASGISVGLIPYHFKNKNELMRQTLYSIMHDWLAFVEEALTDQEDPLHQLRVYVRANLRYMAPRPAHFQAVMEVIFNARHTDGRLKYQSRHDDPGLLRLQEILTAGQASGAFREFPVPAAALMIRAAIDQFLGQRLLRPDFDVEEYGQQLTELIELMVCKR